jgi:hypothetical protein
MPCSCIYEKKLAFPPCWCKYLYCSKDHQLVLLNSKVHVLIFWTRDTLLFMQQTGTRIEATKLPQH